MTNSEYYTYQFYAWEYRGRGWHLSNVPISLEPPFIPFFRHAPKLPVIDDGKRHTIISGAITLLKGTQKPVTDNFEPLDYETLEPFVFEDNSELIALQVKLPKERKITVELMKALITMISFNESPISFEIIGNAQEITIQFVCRVHHSDITQTYIQSYFPECTVIRNNLYIENIFKPDMPVAVIDFGLQEEFVRPLPISKSFTIDPLTAVFGALENLKGNRQAGVQILFSGTVNSWTDSIVRSVTMPDESSFFSDAPESPKLALEKIASPLCSVCIRTFAQAETVDECNPLLAAISNPLLSISGGQSNSLIPLSTQEYDVNTRIQDIYYRQSHRLGMLLSIDELLPILHFPTENIQSRKLDSNTRKTKEPPVIALGKGYFIGTNTHNGVTQSVTFDIDARLKHTHIIGATGTGKSTLLSNLIIADAHKGVGLVLFDPHGDLVDDVIAHMPEERLSDVVLIDPSDTDYPIGLNLLEAHNDIEKEILSSDLVSSFRKLSTSWGDQMNAVFGNAILAMLESAKGGTLHDLRRFLIEKEYRTEFLQTVKDPSVLYYWHKEYPLLKSNSIGSILTRLDSFLRPKTIRNMVIQKTGLDFENLINTNKIILIKLSQGLIGSENSYLLGSLILSKIHQAAFARQSKSTRNPFFIYIDEFQNVITPSIKEMLSGVRKYNVGLILSHQDLQQLQREDSELLNSVLGNTYTRMVFRVGEPDAKRLYEGFSSFTVSDLQNLGRGEAIIRIEQPQYDCSIDTVLLPPIEQELKEQRMASVIEHSRKTYGKNRTEVEDLLSTTLSFTIPKEEKPLVKKRISKEPTQEPKPNPNAAIPSAIEITQAESATEEPVKDISTHRYLQTLVEKMAQARGYTATLEAAIPNGDGKVDVLLFKDGKTIAVEICVTTDSQWEMHNISKCIASSYDVVVSLSGDMKQLEKIKNTCVEGIPDFTRYEVHFFTPDVFFSYLDKNHKTQIPTETISKGYRVNVTYDSVSNEEMNRKKATVAQVVLNSLKRMKK